MNAGIQCSMSLSQPGYNIQNLSSLVKGGSFSSQLEKQAADANYDTSALQAEPLENVILHCV